MRKMLTALPAALVLIAAPRVLTGLYAREKPEHISDLPVRKEVHQQYRLEPNTTVKVSMIAGPVEIETTTGDTAEVTIISSAETQADLDCSDTLIERTPQLLVIRSKDLCTVVRVTQRVTLELPRNANLDLKSIAGDVRIGTIDGMVRLDSIAGHVSAGPVRTADISSLAQGLSMQIDDIGERGVRVSSVIGRIELRLSDRLNAQFVARSIDGNVVSDSPAIAIRTRNGPENCEAQIGSGGPAITVSSVRGNIRLRKIS